MQSKQIGSGLTKRSTRKGSIAWYGVAALALMTFMTSASWTWGFDEPQPETQAVGLGGILDEYAPSGLGESDFAALDGKWADWAQGASEAVTAFYASTGSDVAAQRQAIAKVRAKLLVMERALNDRSYRQLFDPLTTLHGRLVRRVDVAEAVLDTLELNPEMARTSAMKTARQEVEAALADLQAYLSPMKNGDDWLKFVKANEIAKILETSTTPQSALPIVESVQAKFKGRDQLNDVQKAFLSRPVFSGLERAIENYRAVAQQAAQPMDKSALRAELATLLKAIETYETSGSRADAQQVRSAFNRLRDVAPDGARTLAGPLRNHYFNYNMRIVASEAFLNKFVGESRVDDGAVHDFILGARVGGYQSTNSVVELDLKPSGQNAVFDIKLSGVVQSNTQGVTDQATIYTSGYHQFWASKQVEFDGDRFTTRPALISVSANNTTTGARTEVSSLPIFGGIADNIAVDRAREMRPQSEAIAASRVSDRVVPEFNSRVDSQFAELSTKVEEKLNAPLRELELFPHARTYRTTDTELWISTRLMNSGELGGGTPNTAVTSPNGLVVHLHESLINNSLNRMHLNDRTMTEEQFKTELESAMSTMLGRPVKFPESETGDEKEPITLVFPSSDPFRVQARDGILHLVIRAGLLPGEGKEEIPTQEITVPLTFSIEGPNVVIESGTVGVSPVERPESLAKQIARAGVVRTKIQQALPNRSLDRTIDADREGHEPVKMMVADIKVLNGWLSIVFE